MSRYSPLMHRPLCLLTRISYVDMGAFECQIAGFANRSDRKLLWQENTVTFRLTPTLSVRPTNGLTGSRRSTGTGPPAVSGYPMAKTPLFQKDSPSPMGGRAGLGVGLPKSSIQPELIMTGCLVAERRSNGFGNRIKTVSMRKCSLRWEFANPRLGTRMHDSQSSRGSTTKWPRSTVPLRRIGSSVLVSCRIAAPRKISPKWSAVPGWA